VTAHTRRIISKFRADSGFSCSGVEVLGFGATAVLEHRLDDSAQHLEYGATPSWMCSHWQCERPRPRRPALSERQTPSLRLCVWVFMAAVSDEAGFRRQGPQLKGRRALLLFRIVLGQRILRGPLSARWPGGFGWALPPSAHARRSASAPVSFGRPPWRPAAPPPPAGSAPRPPATGKTSLARPQVGPATVALAAGDGTRGSPAAHRPGRPLPPSLHTRRRGGTSTPPPSRHPWGAVAHL
jgi:hypothetical protein